MARRKLWIQESGVRKPGHRGRLHRALGIPENETIPASDLRWAARQPGHLGRMAREAVTLRRLSRRRRTRHRRSR